MDLALQPFQHRFAPLGEMVDLHEGGAHHRLVVLLGGSLVAARQRLHRRTESSRAIARVGRRKEAENNAGDGGMDARFFDGGPEEEAKNGVESNAPTADPVGRDHGAEKQHTPAQSLDIDAVGVEDGDDENRADVVDDGEGEEEDTELRGKETSQQREHAEREGDVGGEGNPPAAAVLPRAVEGEEDEGGHDHPADGRHHGKRRLPRLAQLAMDDLSLDFEADNEEEDRHQAVVDPFFEGEMNPE